MRVVSGLVLAAVGAAGVILGGAPLLVLVAVAVALLSLEWGRMCAQPRRRRRWRPLISVAALAGAVHRLPGDGLDGCLPLGALVAAIAAVRRW